MLVIFYDVNDVHQRVLILDSVKKGRGGFCFKKLATPPPPRALKKKKKTFLMPLSPTNINVH